MKNNNTTFGQFYKTIILIYTAIIIGLVFFMGTVYAINKDSYFALDWQDNKHILGLVAGLFVIVIPKIVFNNSLKTYKGKKSIHKKLAGYLTSFIVYIAIIEGVGFFQIVLFLQTHNKLFLILAAISLLFMLLARPNPDKIVSDLDLSNEEQRYIDKPDLPFDE